MTAELPSVWVLVLNYCSLDDTLACVEAIRQIEYQNLHLLVMDNDSPDNGGEALSKQIPSTEFIRFRENYGYAGGNNRAIKIALEKGADYILIVNPDIRLARESISDYVAIMLSDRNIAGLNSVQLEADGRHIDNNFSSGVLCPAGFCEKLIDEIQLPEQFDSNNLFGAALMLSVDAIRRVGGFDPLYFAYYEEVDLCRRFITQGFRLVVTSKSPVVHLRTIYKKPLTDRVLFLKLKGYYLYMLKNPKVSMLKSLRKIFSDYKAVNRGKAGNIYPYDSFDFDRALVKSVLAWIVLALPKIWLHRKKEKTAGQMYI